MGSLKFSIVVPVKDEVSRLKRSLESFYSVDPDEIIVCTDDPSPIEVVNTVMEIARLHKMEDITYIHPIPRNPEYKYHQAWVRRSGFLKAKNDVILTADVDLELNRNVLNAVRLVGKDNIGLVSLSKFRQPYDILSFMRTFGYFVLRVLYFLLLQHLSLKRSGKGLHVTLFTGLYAFYRPYWRETEDEGVKKMLPSAWKQAIPEETSQKAYNVGEDNYLRDCMEKKYRVLYLTRLGATVIDRDKHTDSRIQFQRGVYSARRGRSLLGAIVHTILRVEPYYFKGFLLEKKRFQRSITPC